MITKILANEKFIAKKSVIIRERAREPPMYIDDTLTSMITCEISLRSRMSTNDLTEERVFISGNNFSSKKCVLSDENSIFGHDGQCYIDDVALFIEAFHAFEPMIYSFWGTMGYVY